ncbi:MAG TPA: hypothetical protein VF911_03515 [Thermoanaerobaculia bacterium]|jgi:hypothetical protein
MNRWAARIAGILLLLVFSMMFLQMYKTLVALQRASAPAATTTAR